MHPVVIRDLFASVCLTACAGGMGREPPAPVMPAPGFAHSLSRYLSFREVVFGGLPEISVCQLPSDSIAGLDVEQFILEYGTVVRFHRGSNCGGAVMQGSDSAPAVLAITSFEQDHSSGVMRARMDGGNPTLLQRRREVFSGHLFGPISLRLEFDSTADFRSHWFGDGADDDAGRKLSLLARFLRARSLLLRTQPYLVLCGDWFPATMLERFVTDPNQQSLTSGIVVDPECQLPMVAQRDSTIETLRVTGLSLRDGNGEVEAERYIAGRRNQREWLETFRFDHGEPVSFVIERIRVYPKD